MSLTVETSDDIDSQVFLWTEKLAESRIEFASLQEERKGLLQRKAILLKLGSKVVTTEDYFKQKPAMNTPGNREIFQNVHDIHTLELRSLELDEKLRIIEIEKEVKEIIKAFQPVEVIPNSNLSNWYQELRTFKQEPDCTIDFVSYQSNVLKFTLLYKGIGLMISITEKQTAEENEYSVKTDMYIENLDTKTKELMVENLPVDNLITFIKSEMDEDIIPYVNCDPED